MVGFKEELFRAAKDDFEDSENCEVEREDESSDVVLSKSTAFEFFVNEFQKALDIRADSLPDFVEKGEELFLRRFTFEMQMQQYQPCSSGFGIWLKILGRKFKHKTDDEEYGRWKKEYLERVDHKMDSEWVTIDYGNSEMRETVTVLASEADYALLNCENFSLSGSRKATSEEIRNAIVEMNRVDE